MPTSKETRVRVDDFANIIAHVCPANGSVLCAPRVCLKVFASRKMVSKSVRGNFSKDNKCFIVQKISGKVPLKENFIPEAKRRVTSIFDDNQSGGVQTQLLAGADKFFNHGWTRINTDGKKDLTRITRIAANF